MENRISDKWDNIQNIEGTFYIYIYNIYLIIYICKIKNR